MTETKFDFFSFLQKAVSTPMVRETTAKEWFESINIRINGRINDFLYDKENLEVILAKISKKQLGTLIKTTFVGEDNKTTYKFDLLECMKRNPALARFIVREFGLAECNNFGFFPYAEIEKSFSSLEELLLGKEKTDFDTNVEELEERLKNLFLLLPETELVSVYKYINKKIEELGIKIRSHTDFTTNTLRDSLNKIETFRERLLNKVSTILKDRLNTVYQACVGAAKDSVGEKIKEPLEKKIGNDSFEVDGDNKKIRDNVDFLKVVEAFDFFNGDSKDKKTERDFLDLKMTEHDLVELQKERKEKAKKEIEGDLKGFFNINTDNKAFPDDDAWKIFIKERVKKYVTKNEDTELEYENKLDKIVGELCSILNKRVTVTVPPSTDLVTDSVLKLITETNVTDEIVKIKEEAIDTLMYIVNNPKETDDNLLTPKQAETLKKFLKGNGVDLDLLGKNSTELKFGDKKKDFNEEGKIFITGLDDVFVFDSDSEISDLKESFVDNFKKQCRQQNIDGNNNPLQNISKVYVFKKDGKEVSLLEEAAELHSKGNKQAKELLEFLSQEQSLLGKHFIDEKTAKKILGKDIKYINNETLLDLFVGCYREDVGSGIKSTFMRNKLYKEGTSRLLGIFDKVAFKESDADGNKKLKDDFAFLDKNGEKRPFTRKFEELADKIKEDIGLVLDGLGKEDGEKKLKDIFKVDKIEDIKIMKLLECIKSTETKEEKEKWLKEFFENKDNSIETITTGMDKLKELVVEAEKKKDKKRKMEEKDKKEKASDTELRRLQSLLDQKTAKVEEVAKVLEDSIALVEIQRKDIEEQQKRLEAYEEENRRIKEELDKARNRDQGRVDQKRTQQTSGQQYRDSRDNYYEQTNRVEGSIFTAKNKEELKANLENVREEVSPKAFVNGMLSAIQKLSVIVRTEKDQFALKKLEDLAEIILTGYTFQDIKTKQEFEKIFNSAGISLNSQNQGQNQPAYGQAPVVQQPIQPQNQPVYGQIPAQQNNTFNIQQPQDAMSLLTALLLPTYMQHLAQMNTANNRFNIIQPLLANMMLMSTAATALLANNAGINLGR